MKMSLAQQVRYLTTKGYTTEDVLLLPTAEIKRLCMKEYKLANQLLPVEEVDSTIQRAA